ncbi:hypothetical protein SAMN05421664_1408 [Chryseobacterium soldanellicola]|uniref:Uncharacterized protein n=1 Tax=Chryseobacterium soldanellicola TaxID=311333 RepID=A0A1H1AG19_9FLAO|nr:hypothetical protein [Chryseobacterium soldanellicola]SDQ38645.1 hypothetical protein SAMN05421664_1408 [Chryseobacterium soldanellicola]
MKKLTFIFFLSILCFVKSQTKVAGTYHVSSGNPDDGGYNWVLLDSHDFAMFTFGQIIAGKWSIDNKNVITFKPNIPQYPFDVYGRFDPKVKGTKIMFSNFNGNEDAFIGNSEQGIQPVLSPDANCLPYPLLKEFNDQFKDILLSVSSYNQEKATFYKADFQKYNDFIVTYYSSSVMVKPFTAELKDDKLYFERKERPSSERKDIKPEELKEFEMYLSQGTSSEPKESIVGNKSYNIISYGIGESQEKFDEETFLKFNYKYDPSTEIYTAKNKYNVPKDDAYHDLNTLYKYHRIELKTNQNSYQKSNKSIFNITCKN